MPFNALPTRKRVATRFFGFRNVSWPNARKFCAPKFQEFCKFFARCRCKICVSRRQTRACSNVNALMTWWRASKMSCGFKHTQDYCTQLLVRATRRKFPKILQFFCAILAQPLRDLDAERAPFRIGTHFRLGSTSATFFSMRSARWPSARNLCSRGAPDFLKNSSREFGAKFA